MKTETDKHGALVIAWWDETNRQRSRFSFDTVHFLTRFHQVVKSRSWCMWRWDLRQRNLVLAREI